MRFTATVLIENTTESEALKSEHGLSILITGEDGYRLLLDTGDSAAFLDNARVLGADLNGLDALVISHNHHDHAGGLLPLLDRVAPPKELYLGWNFFEPRYKRELGRMRGISGRVSESDLMSRRINYSILNRSICYPLHEGIWLVAGFTSCNRFETPFKAMLRLSQGEYETDSFCDEIAVVLEGEQGLTVISGCAHNGMINICQRVSNYFERPVDTFIGGTHLKDADNARIRSTIKAVNYLKFRRVGACHCNGAEAGELFARDVRGFFSIHSGSVIEI